MERPKQEEEIGSDQKEQEEVTSIRTTSTTRNIRQRKNIVELGKKIGNTNLLFTLLINLN